MIATKQQHNSKSRDTRSKEHTNSLNSTNKQTKNTTHTLNLEL